MGGRFKGPFVEDKLFEKEVPEEIKTIIFSMIQDIKGKPSSDVGFMQDFEMIKEKEGFQTIKRFQWFPRLIETKSYPCECESISGTVFVVDWEDHNVYFLYERKENFTYEDLYLPKNKEIDNEDPYSTLEIL